MPMVWIDTVLSEAIASGAQDQLRLGAPVADISILQRRIERFTVMRIIIGMDIMPTVRDSGEGDQVVTLGIGVMSNEAIGASQLPDPETPGDFPQSGWL